MTPVPTVDLRSTLVAVPTAVDVVTVVGPDAAAYLQGQLSQDIAALPVGGTVPALLLQPTGKLTAWLRVQRTADDAFALVVESASGDAVLSRLQRFKLRTDATLGLTTRRAVAVRGPGATGVAAEEAGTLLVPAGWPGMEGVDLIAAPDAPAPAHALVEVAPSALEALRIEAGVPAMGAELTDATIPAEAGQWLIDASVSFTKGCYTGQELVARIDSRGGNVPRPVRGLLVHGAPEDVDGVGTSAVQLAGAEVGIITSVAHSASLGLVALAPLGRAVEVGTDVVVATPAGALDATVVALPMR